RRTPIWLSSCAPGSKNSLSRKFSRTSSTASASSTPHEWISPYLSSPLAISSVDRHRRLSMGSFPPAPHHRWPRHGLPLCSQLFRIRPRCPASTRPVSRRHALLQTRLSLSSLGRQRLGSRPRLTYFPPEGLAPSDTSS